MQAAGRQMRRLHRATDRRIKIIQRDTSGISHSRSSTFGAIRDGSFQIRLIYESYHEENSIVLTYCIDEPDDISIDRLPMDGQAETTGTEYLVLFPGRDSINWPTAFSYQTFDTIYTQQTGSVEFTRIKFLNFYEFRQFYRYFFTNTLVSYKYLFL